MIFFHEVKFNSLVNFHVIAMITNVLKLTNNEIMSFHIISLDADNCKNHK